MKKWVEHAIYVWGKEIDVRRIVTGFSCSKCGYTTDKKTNYCPHCGTKMEED